MGMFLVSVLSPFLFALVVDVITVMATKVVLSELLYADDLVQMNETIESLRNKLLKWMKAFDRKGLIINLE